MTRGQVSGLSVMAWCAAAVCATALLPPAVATWLHRSRVAETRAVLLETAALLRTRPLETGLVTCGPGRRPNMSLGMARARGLASAYPRHVAWLQRLGDAGPFLATDRPDAWQQCLLLTVSADGSATLMSAGANGLVETAADGVSQGDDLVERVR